mgnify:CR=1 FL=1
MYKRQLLDLEIDRFSSIVQQRSIERFVRADHVQRVANLACLLYTSDAADERSSVDLGGRRIIKKKKNTNKTNQLCTNIQLTNHN